MIELLQFQRSASACIADRFLAYLDDPVIVGTKKTPKRIPFFQALSSLTASGKTVILADAVASISSALPFPPIVLWLSKGKVVVEQSYANLLDGGKYHHLLGAIAVKSLAEYDALEVRESSKPVVFFATVGTFNQRDKEEGNRLIYRCDIDTAEQSTWDALKERAGQDGARRPLIIVYDEAHNLSDQQTDLLLELEPDGFLLASATMRLPARLAEIVEALKSNGKEDRWLITSVSSAEVADSGLVKSTIVLGGYNSPMEETITAMLTDMRQAAEDGKSYGLEGRPKAIYVTNTNILADDAFRRDDPKRPFRERQAPPILIWRYLTEQCGVDPSEIAVYCSLTVHKDYPLPEEFVLFKGGDSDYDNFTRGSYQHIIFNLSLQEGWDDPLCYFAYVDKSMESRVQVEQIIGRLLRQPGANHYAAERLNTAHFYVRVDRNETFNQVLADVSARLASDVPQVRIVKSPPGKPRPREYPVKRELEVPATAYDSTGTIKPIERIIASLSDYRFDEINTRGVGSRRLAQQRIGSELSVEQSWSVFEQSSRVSARWVFHREIKRRFARALEVASTADQKFDARIGIGSNAYEHVANIAADVVDAYLDNVKLVQRKLDPYKVGPILARAEEIISFQNSLHEGYDGLNAFELDFAHAIDKVGQPWCRNLPRTGYGIPLITPGATTVFYPDFLIWNGAEVICVDTKGEHLLADAAKRKLLSIRHRHDSSCRLTVRFVSRGQWNKNGIQETSEGYTLWGLREDGTHRAVVFEDLDGLIEALLSSDS